MMDFKILERDIVQAHVIYDEDTDTVILCEQYMENLMKRPFGIWII